MGYFIWDNNFIFKAMLQRNCRFNYNYGKENKYSLVIYFVTVDLYNFCNFQFMFT